MNFGEAKLTVSAMVIEDTRNMCGNLHPNSVNRVIFSGFDHHWSLSSAVFGSEIFKNWWSGKAASDSIEKTVEIKPEGLIRFKTYSRLICIESRSRSRTIRLQLGIHEPPHGSTGRSGPDRVECCLFPNKGWTSTDSKCSSWFSSGE